MKSAILNANLSRVDSKLLKNARLRRCAHHLTLRCTVECDSFLMTLHIEHSNIFEQPEEIFESVRNFYKFSRHSL